MKKKSNEQKENEVRPNYFFYPLSSNKQVAAGKKIWAENGESDKLEMKKRNIDSGKVKRNWKKLKRKSSLITKG